MARSSSHSNSQGVWNIRGSSNESEEAKLSVGLGGDEPSTFRRLQTRSTSESVVGGEWDKAKLACETRFREQEGVLGRREGGLVASGTGLPFPVDASDIFLLNGEQK